MPSDEPEERRSAPAARTRAPDTQARQPAIDPPAESGEVQTESPARNDGRATETSAPPASAAEPRNASAGHVDEPQPAKSLEETTAHSKPHPPAPRTELASPADERAGERTGEAGDGEDPQ